MVANFLGSVFALGSQPFSLPSAWGNHKLGLFSGFYFGTLHALTLEVTGVARQSAHLLLLYYYYFCK